MSPNSHRCRRDDDGTRPRAVYYNMILLRVRGWVDVKNLHKSLAGKTYFAVPTPRRTVQYNIIVGRANRTIRPTKYFICIRITTTTDRVRARALKTHRPFRQLCHVLYYAHAIIFFWKMWQVWLCGGTRFESTFGVWGKSHFLKKIFFLTYYFVRLIKIVNLKFSFFFCLEYS